MRTKQWVYLRPDTGEEELYDLDHDPYQLESRHDQAANTGVKADLIDLTEELRTCAGVPCKLVYSRAELPGGLVDSH